MLIHNPEIPAWIDAEIKTLEALTLERNISKLKARRFNPNGVEVDLYYHTQGTDLYFCDIKQTYFHWSEIIKEASAKINRGRFLYLAVIECETESKFISSLFMPAPFLN